MSCIPVALRASRILRADDSVNLSPFGLGIHLLMEARANSFTHRILSLKGKIKCSSCS